MRSRFDRFSWLLVNVLFALVVTPPTLATAQTRGNPICPHEDVFFNPGNGENIVVPKGFEVSVFAKDLNFPTAAAFRGDSRRLDMFLMDSGRGVRSNGNDQTSRVAEGESSTIILFTPAVWVVDES